MVYHGQGWGQDTPRNMDHNYIDWEELATEGGRGLHEHYKRVIHLRAQHPALRSPNIAFDAILPDRQAVAYHRWDGGGGVVVVVANFDDKPQKVPFEMPHAGKWREFFSNQEMDLGGHVEIDVDYAAAKVFIKV